MDELELLSQLGLLTPEQRQQTERNARVQGLLSLGSALMQAGQGGGGRRVSTLQGLGMAAPAYMQGQQRAFDETLQGILKRTQLQDLLAKRQEQEMAKRRQEQFQQALRGTIRQVPTEQSLMAAQSNIDPSMLEGMTAGQVGQQAISQGLPTRAAFDREAYMSALAQYAPEQYAQMMTRPEEEFTLSEGQIRYRGGRPIAMGAPKAPDYSANYRDYLQAKQEGFQGSFVDYTTQQRKAGAAQISLSTERKLGETLGVQTGEAISASKKAADDAGATLQTVNEIRPLLQQGVFEGQLGSAQAFVSRLGTSLGITGQNTQEVLNRTSAAMQGLASLELQAAGQLRGQGQITEGERALIARVAGGKLNELTAGEINTLLGALEKTARFRIKKHNQTLDNLIKKTPSLSGTLEFYRVDLIPANVGVEKL